MRYKIFNLNQDTLIDLGLGVEDALFLDWFLNFSQGGNMKRRFVEDIQDIGYWVSYSKVINDLPILFSKPCIKESDTEEERQSKIDKSLKANKAKIARMLKGNLSKVLTRHNIVKKGANNQAGSQVYISINRSAIDSLKGFDSEESNKKVVPTAIDTTDKELENNFDNTIISDNTESIPQEINVNEKSTYTEKEIRDIAYNNLKDGPLFEKYPEVTKALKIEAEVKKLKTRLELGLNI